MKKRTDQDLTKLADAAFKQAAQKVIERAENTGTPIIIFLNNEVKAVDPRTMRNRNKPRKRRKVDH